MISGNPVTPSIGVTGIAAAARDFDVPPVEMTSMPSSTAHKGYQPGLVAHRHQKRQAHRDEVGSTTHCEFMGRIGEESRGLLGQELPHHSRRVTA